MKAESIMDKLQKVLLPVGEAFAQQRHIKAITNGMMSIVGLSIIGAIFQIIKSPPVTAEVVEAGGILATLFGGWFQFATQYNDILSVPYNMTVGLMSVVVVFTIAYNLGKSYKLDGVSSGTLGLVIFLIVAAPIQTVVLENGTTFTGLDATFLGGLGLFTAIIIAIVSVEITRFCTEKNLIIKLPEVVPPFLIASFNSIIPLFVNVIIFYGLNLLLITFVGANLPSLILGLLAAPLGYINSVPGIIFLGAFTCLLWAVGIHGATIVGMVLVPIMLQDYSMNAALVGQGLEPVFTPIMLYGAVTLVGGSGNTLGLSILSMRSKSKQLRAIGNIGILPGIFSVNEPVIFGTPIVFNPILVIPFVLSPVIIGIIMWIGYAIGFLDPAYIFIFTAMPLGVGMALGAMSIKNFIFTLLMIPVSILIFYPFFKVYEKQLIEKEQLAEAEIDEEKAEAKLIVETAK